MLAGAAHTFAWRTPPGALVAGLVVVALGVSACGSSGSDGVTIPKANSDQLLADLDQVQSACASQSRADAVTAAQDFVDTVNVLPKEVGTEAKDALRDAGANLKTLASNCEEPAGTSDVPTTPVAPTTSSAATTTTTTTSTESQPPPAQNPGEGNGPPSGGNSGGNGGGNGGSGGIGGDKAR